MLIQLQNADGLGHQGLIWYFSTFLKIFKQPQIVRLQNADGGIRAARPLLLVAAAQGQLLFLLISRRYGSPVMEVTMNIKYLQVPKR